MLDKVRSNGENPPNSTRTPSLEEAMRVGKCWLLSFLLLLSTVGNSSLFAQNPIPMVAQPLVPTAVSPGGPGFTLTVNGTGFVSGSVVNWNGSPRPTTFVSRAQVTAEIPDTDIATPQTGWVTVVNPAPGGGVSNVEYLHVAVPTSYVPFNRSLINTGLSTISDVAASDCNGDGRLDLLVRGTVSGTAAVVTLLGNGDGTFQPPAPNNECPIPEPRWDFNGDGIVDRAAVAPGPFPGRPSLSFSIQLGYGDGTFQPPVFYGGCSLGPGHLIVSDFNGDGILDIASACDDFMNDFLGIWLGNGDGTFQYRFGFYLAFPFVTELLAVDFNQDGKLDLAATPEESFWEMSIWLGNGDGTFQSGTEFGVVMNMPKFLAPGDFNADGRLDLAAGGGTLSMLLGIGDGSFQPAITYYPPYLVRPVVVGDFNGDGRLDLAGAYVDYGSNSPYGSLGVMLQAPLAEVSPASLTFQEQATGTSSTAQSVTFSNHTFSDLTISSITANGDFALTHNCPMSPSTLAPGGNCALDVVFNPKANAVRNGDATIAHDGPNSPLVIPLTGTGIAPPWPTADLSSTSITFARQHVGASGSSETVVLTNNGSVPLTISGVTTSSADFGVLNACSSSVDPGASCPIGVFFRPLEAGSRTGELIITDNAPGSPHKATLMGVGTDFVITVSADSSTSRTITPGQTARYTLFLNPLSGFTGALALTCEGAPPLSSCAILPTSVTLNGPTARTIMVAVRTTASSMSAPRGPLLPPRFDAPTHRSQWRPALLALCLLVLAVTAMNLRFRGVDSRRSPVGSLTQGWLALKLAPALAVMLSALMLWPACGGGGAVIHNPGTPPGTYTLTIAGTVTSTSSSLSRGLTLTLKVN